MDAFETRRNASGWVRIARLRAGWIGRVLPLVAMLVPGCAEDPAWDTASFSVVDGGDEDGGDEDGGACTPPGRASAGLIEVTIGSSAYPLRPLSGGAIFVGAYSLAPGTRIHLGMGRPILEPLNPLVIDFFYTSEHSGGWRYYVQSTPVSVLALYETTTFMARVQDGCKVSFSAPVTVRVEAYPVD